MGEEIRIWEVGEADKLTEINRARLNLEQRIEKWLVQDITILARDLLVIGEQVATDFGGWIDLLCLNSEGNPVILELKRDKTPREITAQVLDYASWVKALSAERISTIASEYLKEPLEEAFERRFGEELPDLINERHSMVVIGSEIDESSERIIRYLSDSYGVDINAATFGYFCGENGHELLARTFLVEPAEVQKRASARSGTRVNSTLEELQSIADLNGVGSLYRSLKESLSQWLNLERRKRSLTFSGYMPDGTRKAIFNLLPDQSTANNGLKYQLYMERLASYSGAQEQDLLSFLPPRPEKYQYYPNAPSDLSGWTGFFANEEDVHRFVKGLASTTIAENPPGTQVRSAAAREAWDTRHARARAQDE